MSTTPALAGGKSQQFTISNIDTIFSFYKPSLPLSKFVDSFWLYEGYQPERKTERILPTGTLELAINLGRNELRFYDAERPEKCSHFSGAIVSGAHGCGLAPAEEAFMRTSTPHGVNLSQLIGRINRTSPGRLGESVNVRLGTLTSSS